MRRWVHRLAATLLALLPAVSGGESPHSSAPELPTDPVLAKLIEQSLAARPELGQAGGPAASVPER